MRSGDGAGIEWRLTVGIYVYPTDLRWFRFLRDRAPLDEVNFWQPGGSSAFARLQPGEIFLFRLKSPINAIAGGGIFEHGSVFPLNAAWDAFREKNGVAAYPEFFRYIEGYRRKMGMDLHEDSPIGCIVLRSPFFLPERDWIPVPDDYSLNLVQGKRYELQSTTGRTLHHWAENVLRSQTPITAEELNFPSGVEEPTYGDPILAKRRLGQGTFRLLVSDAYSRRCAVTGEKTLPVLEAAHIRPVSRGGEHRIDNGLLLRSDLHRLFDLGYVTITPPGNLRVSAKLRETWLNGRVYYDLDGASIRMPEQANLRPSRLILEWHNDEVFRG